MKDDSWRDTPYLDLIKAMMWVAEFFDDLKLLTDHELIGTVGWGTPSREHEARAIFILTENDVDLLPPGDMELASFGPRIKTRGYGWRFNVPLITIPNQDMFGKAHSRIVIAGDKKLHEYPLNPAMFMTPLRYTRFDPYHPMTLEERNERSKVAS